MSKEIYINTGSTFQQPYQGQRAVNGQEPNIKQKSVPTIGSTQNPFTSQSRQPFTYQNIVEGREPNIRDSQTPFTYQRTGQTPVIYQHPTTYQHTGQSPFIYQVQSPYTYQNPVDAQEPNIRDRQNPYPYIANVQYTTEQSYTENAQQPLPNSQLQQPNIRNKQNQSPYITQQPNPIIYQTPSQTASQAQQPNPFTYQTNPAFIPFGGYNPWNGEYEEDWGSAQRPSPYIAQNNTQNNTSGQGAMVSSQYQQASSTQTPYTFQFSGRSPGFWQMPLHPSEPREPILYRQPVVNQPRNARQPTIVQNNQPVIVFQPFTNQVSAQESNPFTYQYGSPYIGEARSPFIAQIQVQSQHPSTTNATGRTPLTYSHPSPFTYRNPVSAQEDNAKNKQQPYPYIADAQNTENLQQPYPYTAQARQPATYDHRSPFTYANPVDGQSPFISQHRSPSTYQYNYQMDYDHQSPFTYQQPYTTTRPIGPLAKVKGVFVNEGGSVNKVERIDVNDAGNPEQIHEAVPNAQYSK